MRDANDIRNPNKKYSAQEVDVILTATVKNSGFQAIKSFKHPVTRDIAFTLYTNGKRYIAVFMTANDSAPQKNQNGKITDKNVTGNFTLDDLLKFYIKSMEKYQSNKNSELIIPLCLCPNDPDDPKHLVYLKIHKINNKMHATILDSTGKANWSVVNLKNALNLNFPDNIIDHPISFNEERMSSNGVNDGPFTIENIRADLEDYEIIEDSHSGKKANQLREEQYTLAQSFFNKDRSEELTRLHEQSSPRAHTDLPEHGIKYEDETSFENALPKAISNLESTISELESWQKTIEPKQLATMIGKHREPILSRELMSNIEPKTQKAYLSQLKLIQNNLTSFRWDQNDQNSVDYNITLHLIDHKNNKHTTQMKTIKIPPVIAAIIESIKPANDSDAEQVMQKIRKIASTATTDKTNRWHSSDEAKKYCAKLVEEMDHFNAQQNRPTSPKHQA